MKIVKATSKDDEVLTSITKKSKAFWGYSAEQILKWNDSLTVSKEYIETYNVFKLITEDTIIGYYSYFNIEKDTIKLDNLFILPEHIGKGFGKLLMNDFLNKLEKSETKKVQLHADPNAENFYLKLGFKKVGEFETTIKNRFMPIMELDM
ncbi:GNAT family N-acetyltransferase [Flavobacterium sp.]|uniref:GNAT family N-acetyltransferase n=1 Tax=Flavobacterium sp. TaxID=239 RepID=UPI00375356F6